MTVCTTARNESVAAYYRHAGAVNKSARTLIDLVVPEFEPKKGPAVELWLSQVDRVIEGLNIFNPVLWSEEELNYALTAKLVGEAATWASTFHASLRPNEKTYTNLKEKLCQRYGRHESNMELYQQVATRMEVWHETYDDYAAALRLLGAGVQIPDEWYANTFIEGLGPSASQHLRARRAHGPIDFNAAVMFALEVAKESEHEPRKDGAWNSRRGSRTQYAG